MEKKKRLKKLYNDTALADLYFEALENNTEYNRERLLKLKNIDPTTFEKVVDEYCAKCKVEILKDFAEKLKNTEGGIKKED